MAWPKNKSQMPKRPISDITIAEVMSLYKGSHIGEDILLLDNLGRLPLPTEPRRIKSVLLAFCSKGRAQYSVDTEERMVQAGDVIIIGQGQVIDNYMLSPDLEGIGVLLSYDYFREIVKDIRSVSELFIFSRAHPVFRLEESEVERLTAYYNMIRLKVEDEDLRFRRDVVRSLIAALIYDLSDVIFRIQQRQQLPGSRLDAIFSEFIRLVERNFKQERRVSWYSQKMSISPKYLSEAVKQVSHKTPNEWIDNYVILEIRVLLKNTTKSIKEIAQELSFANQSFLGKYFKERVGQSPSEYRRK